MLTQKMIYQTGPKTIEKALETVRDEYWQGKAETWQAIEPIFRTALGMECSAELTFPEAMSAGDLAAFTGSVNAQMSAVHTEYMSKMAGVAATLSQVLD